MKRPAMPRPPARFKINEPYLLDNLRYVEHVIEEAYWKLTESQRKRAGADLYNARELVRQAGAKIGDN